MIRPRKPRILMGLVALGVVLGICSATPSQAFTLIESQLLPAVQLVDAQSAAIIVSNVTSNTTEVVISVFRGNGTLLTQKDVAIGPFASYKLTVTSYPNAAMVFHAMVGLGTAHSVVSDVMTFDKTTGQVIAILPYIEPDTN